MSGNRRPQGSIQPLSVGNVVSTGVRLYRSHFKLYLGLSAKAYLWILVPIYGWAKFSAISAMISRLAFAELIDQPESVEMAQDKVNSRMWSFLWLIIRLFLFFILVYLGLAVVGTIIGAILGVILGVISYAVLGSSYSVASAIILGILVFLFIIFGFTWFCARWIISQVILAVEENLSAAESMKKSWSLSKNSVLRIQAIIIIATIVSLPILGPTSYLPSIFLATIEPGSSLYWIVYSISTILSLIGGAIIMPFWQTIQAAIYYDLRSRREGLGLKLRDHKI
jgi:hypothetical protein